VSAVPMYNSFEDAWVFYRLLKESI